MQLFTSSPATFYIREWLKIYLIDFRSWEAIIGLLDKK